MYNYKLMGLNIFGFQNYWTLSYGYSHCSSLDRLANASTLCQCPFDTISIVFLELGVQEDPGLFCMFSAPRTGIIPFSQEPGSLEYDVESPQNDHAPLGTRFTGLA